MGQIFGYIVLGVFGVILLGSVLGTLGLILAATAAFGILFACLYFVMERLDRMEKKLDALTPQAEKPESNHSEE